MNGPIRIAVLAQSAPNGSYARGIFALFCRTASLIQHEIVPA
jgi:hypothetical protein